MRTFVKLEESYAVMRARHKAGKPSARRPGQPSQETEQGGGSGEATSLQDCPAIEPAPDQSPSPPPIAPPSPPADGVGARGRVGMGSHDNAPGPGAGGKITGRLRVAVPDPEKTSSPAYRQLVASYGEHDAARLLFRDALTEWLETYGSDTPIDEAAAYPGKSTFTTTRTLDAALIAAVRSRIDPMNRRSIYRVFGVIARNAIASYIARH